ncbi:hypothetical protein FRC07_011596, partial [Ceratobasidium sp. 392]
VRIAAQDVVLDIKAFEEANREPGPPFWAHPIRPDVLKNNCGYPNGTVPLLCGTLYEASYHQAFHDDTLEPRFWSHIASLVRCGTCLFKIVHSSRQWCDLVRIFATYHVPLYNRPFPQIVGPVPGDLWSVDRVCDEIRGQRWRESLEQSAQAQCRYRQDELLELAGVTMLGVIESGPVDTRGITNSVAVKFMQKFILLPQVWFALPTASDPAAKSIVRELLARSRAPDASFTFHASLPNDPAITRAIRTAPGLANVLRLQPGSVSRWQPARVNLSDIQLLTRLEFDPVPKRIASDICLIEIAYKTQDPTGVKSILDLLLDVCMSVHQASSPCDLALKLENILEHDLKIVNRDHTGAFTYSFDGDPYKPDDEVHSQDSVSEAPPEFGSPTILSSREHSSTSPSSPISVTVVPAAVESKPSSIPVVQSWEYLDDDSLPDLSDWGITLPR